MGTCQNCVMFLVLSTIAGHFKRKKVDVKQPELEIIVGSHAMVEEQVLVSYGY